MSSTDSQTPGCVAVAVQGGSAHGAFAWGALDRLMELRMPVARVCGVSSGAFMATFLVQGLVRGGHEGARVQMRRLWERIAQAHALSPLRSSPLERWLWGWDMSNTPLWQGIETAMRLFSPAQLNPLGHNPLRPLVDDLLDPDALVDPRAPHLTVAATDVETGEARLFGNAEIGIEALLASACLPFVFPAVEIDGHAYWDGGYAGNPPLYPLLQPSLPQHLVLIRAQPVHRSGVPTTPTEILNRLNELAFHAGLVAELAALPAEIALVTIDADDTLRDLPISSRFNGEPDFLSELFEAGRKAADRASAQLPLGRRKAPSPAASG
jgi:NTE family protein